MYKICILEDSALRQRELEKSFLSVLSTHSYEELSISDLCRHLGIPRKSFYRYFSGKEGALAALLDHTLMDFESSAHAIDADHISSLDILKYFFDFWQKQKLLLDILERDKLSMVLYQRALELFSHETSVFSQFISRHPAQLYEQRFRFVICGIMTMVISWHHCDYQPPVSHMIQTAEKLLTQPLFQ